MGQAAGKASFARCLLVLLTVTAGVAALGARLLPDVLELGATILGGALGGEPFDEVLVEGCEAAVIGCAVWLWLATAVVAGDAARGRRARRRCVPGAVRRLVLAACGVALVGGLGAPANADEAARGADRPDTSLVEGLPLPDRATATTLVSRVFARAAAHPQPAGSPSQRRPAVVEVRPGDTLWAIARADLAADAAEAAVALHVREIHQANRAVIGPDPDLIRPGQQLRMPPPTTIREELR